MGVLVVNTTPRQCSPPRKETLYPLYRGWVGPGHPPGFDPLTIQPVASRYTAYAIPTYFACTTVERYQTNVCEQEVYSNNAVRMRMFTVRSRMHTRTFGP